MKFIISPYIRHHAPRGYHTGPNQPSYKFGGAFALRNAIATDTVEKIKGLSCTKPHYRLTLNAEYHPS